MPNFGPDNDGGGGRGGIWRDFLADFCSKDNCECSGPDAPVACVGHDNSCADTTCEECFLSSRTGAGFPAGDFTCWDWNQSVGNCIKEPGINPGYCSCSIEQDQFACEEGGGIWGGWGSNCDGICPNPHDECEDYPPAPGGSCLTNCLAGVDAIIQDHMNNCREVYDGDMEDAKKLLKKINPDDPIRCILLCEVERMFCDCKKIGDKKRCLLNNVCWVAYDQRNGTDGSQAVLDNCLSQIDETSCIGGSNSNHCNCAEILERSTSSEVFDLHNEGGKFIKTMYKNFYSVMDTFENSSTPKSLPLGGDDDCETRCEEYFKIQLVIKNTTTFKKLNRNNGVLETFAIIEGGWNTTCPTCDALPGDNLCESCCDGSCGCLENPACNTPLTIPIGLKIEGIYPQGINFEYFNAPIYASTKAKAENSGFISFRTDPIRIPEDGGLIGLTPYHGPYQCCETFVLSSTVLDPSWDSSCRICETTEPEEGIIPPEATCCKSNSIYPINRLYPEHLIPTSWGPRPGYDFTHPNNTSPGTIIRIATKSDNHHITPNAPSGEPPVARSTNQPKRSNKKRQNFWEKYTEEK